jgi:predicted oxidoreductase
MKSISASSTLSFSRLAYGCWRIGAGWDSTTVSPTTQSPGHAAVVAAFEAGYTLFDHADIYCDGEAERIFGQVLREVAGMRERVVIATKCGIRKPGDPKPDSPYRYDFSGDYIVGSCEQSLKRLGIETIDLYLLHRPDYLMDPTEVAGAFDRLKRTGKVREFGVSNFRPSQVTALQKACPMPLLANQVEISLANLSCFEDGTLDQCLTEKIVPLAWSPLAGGKLGDGPKQVLPAQEAYQTDAICVELDAIARARGVSRTAVSLAWLLRHPARIVPVVGSTNPDRIRDAAGADKLELARDEWYRLLRAAHGTNLP